MSLLKADTIKPVTSGADLSLHGDSGGVAVDCLNIDSSGDIDFDGNTNAKIKLPSAGGIYESDGSTAVLTESGGVVTLSSAVAIAAASGHAKGVQSVVKSDTETLTTTATWTNIAGLTLTTPTLGAAANKVLLMFSGNFGISNTHSHFIRFARGGTGIGVGASAGSRSLVGAQLDWGDEAGSMTDNMRQSSLLYLDTPGSVGPFTYTVQMLNHDGGTLYVNRTDTDTDNASYGRTSSSLTLMEIVG